MFIDTHTYPKQLRAAVKVALVENIYQYRAPRKLFKWYPLAPCYVQRCWNVAKVSARRVVRYLHYS